MLVGLRQWLEREHHDSASRSGQQSPLGWTKPSILKRTRVAYGLTHLLRQVCQQNLVSSLEELKSLCSFDNFIVLLSEPSLSAQATAQATGQASEDIIGINMIEPTLLAQLIEPFFLNGMFDGGSNDGIAVGKYVVVEIESRYLSMASFAQCDERTCCHFLGLLLHALFLHGFQSPVSGPQQMSLAETPNNLNGEPARKRSTAHSTSNEEFVGLRSSLASLLELGSPSSIHRLVEDLVICGTSRNSPNSSLVSLEIACSDIHSMILEPDRFLFDQCHTNNPSLQIREEKVYGREKECKLISDAFIRASSVKSEAFFIGGYSGSGKTRLVESLRHEVNTVGGFFIKLKLDLMESSSYSAVIGAFNNLCIAIKNRTSPADLLPLVTNLMDEFYLDFFSLGQLLPNVYELCPVLRGTYANVQSSPNANLNSVSVVLQRFMRVISTPSRPAMFFLDDLQWADNDSLKLFQDILSDVLGSCFFFVGSYRDNEVDSSHPIFDMMNNLNTFGVRTTRLNLEGISRVYLNSMVSDALCLLPRYCEPLSNVIFEKTDGNPLFVLKFLQSLVDRKLLQYSFRERRWVWDINRISSENMADGVLSLLAAKMMNLDGNARYVIQAMACFGIKVNINVVQCLLNSTPEFSNLLSILDEIVARGFMVKDGSEYRFVHDKVREAAFSLIPADERSQKHYDLAVLLYRSMQQGEDFDGVIFTICDQLLQIEHVPPVENVVQIDLVGLFIKGGSKAHDRSEYPRARGYFAVAEKLLPTDYWSTHYDQCLKFFYLHAKASRSCGFVEEAIDILKVIVAKTLCLNDKLDALYMLASIHVERNQGESAYAIGCTVLSQIHEQVPDSFPRKDVLELIDETIHLLNSMSDDELLQLQEADKELCATLKFYTLMCNISFGFKAEALGHFICKLTQLSIKKGVSEYSAVGLSWFTIMLCFDMSLKDIPMAMRTGKVAMSFQKRFELKDHITVMYSNYYGFVAPYSEPMQSCADMHKMAFSHGMSIGDTAPSLCHPFLYLRSAFLSGESLSKLSRDADYYMGLVRKFGHSYANSLTKQWQETFLVISTGVPKNTDFNISGQPAAATINHHFHLAVQSFWIHAQGQFEVSSKNVLSAKGINILHAHTILFYIGLNIIRAEKGESILDDDVSTAQNCVKEFKRLAEYSPWNFSNKYHLLEAEVLRVTVQNDKAKESYAAAIEAAQKSKFVHEEGLAHELAGYHCLNLGETPDVLAHLSRAKDCYAKWGSSFKVEFVESISARVTTISKQEKSDEITT